MKKVLFTLLAASMMLVAFNGCSKKAADKLTGKWVTSVEMPAPPNPETGAPSGEKLKIDVSYEFTKTNMNVEIKGPNMPPQKIETTYTVKSDDGNTVTLEVVLPDNKQKVEFKITITDNKMKMVDPDGQTVDLTKI